MSKKLFVGGLSWGTTDDSLRQAFAPFGDVADARVITDRETGRSRGFGFITYETEEEASAALKEMNGATLDGRAIKVDSAQDKGRTGGGGGGGGGRSGGFGGGGGGFGGGGGGFGGGGRGGGFGGAGGGGRGGGRDRGGRGGRDRDRDQW